jgi:precorrin-6y C5,15-methyltransferase (decarboxylating) CbiE subunit
MQGCPVTCVGIGPGDPQYVTLAARQAIEGAEFVAGFATALAVVQAWITGMALPMTYHDQEAILAHVGTLARSGFRCVVCFYGDLNVSSGELRERVVRHCGEPLLVPGISSVQVALARAGLFLEDTLFFTLHARAEQEERRAALAAAIAAGTRHVIALPSPYDFMPGDVARYLLRQDMAPSRPVKVYQRLTLAGEAEMHLVLGDLAACEIEFSDLSIMVFPRPAEKE